jgi:hypothetical protein
MGKIVGITAKAGKPVVLQLELYRGSWSIEDLRELMQSAPIVQIGIEDYFVQDELPGIDPQTGEIHDRTAGVRAALEVARQMDHAAKRDGTTLTFKSGDREATLGARNGAEP